MFRSEKSIMDILNLERWKFLEFSYLKKWTIFGLFIGSIAGVGSIVFFLLVQNFSQIFLGSVTGFLPPASGTDVDESYSMILENRWLFPIITGIGGLVVGLISTRFAPESQGHGTDAVIDAFHNKNGEIRLRVPFIKAITSAITIGSGGSGGREGPTAQISAGISSFLAKFFKFDEREQRIAVAAGLGAGIGSIFKAPLGAALFSTEIFYKRDFEVDALLPSLIAAVTGFTIFGTFFGWSPIFDISQSAIVFDDPSSLIIYALLGLVCAAGGVAYVNCFYRVQALFQKMKLPIFIKPAIGGAIVGVIAMFVPQVLGTGYGWLQIGIFNDPMFFPLWMLLGIALLKIVATSFSIGSGGSAGIFGPGLVIGGFLGAFVATCFHDIGMFESVDVSTVAIIGMVAFFGGVSKSPLSTIVIGSEMTRGYALLPAMIISVVIAYSIMKLDTTIYRSQVTDRSQSPAHKKEYQVPLLKKLLVKDSMDTYYPSLSITSTIEEITEKIKNYGTENILITENQKFVGIINKNNLNDYSDTASLVKTVDAAIPSESLYDVMKKMSKINTNELPVIDSDSERVLGIISLSGMMRVYDLELGVPKDKTMRLSGST